MSSGRRSVIAFNSKRSLRRWLRKVLPDFGIQTITETYMTSEMLSPTSFRVKITLKSSGLIPSRRTRPSLEIGCPSTQQIMSWRCKNISEINFGGAWVMQTDSRLQVVANNHDIPNLQPTVQVAQLRNAAHDDSRHSIGGTNVRAKRCVFSRLEV
jgi:hypothetical protein